MSQARWPGWCSQAIAALATLSPRAASLGPNVIVASSRVVHSGASSNPDLRRDCRSCLASPPAPLGVASVVIPALAVPALLVVQWPFEEGHPPRPARGLCRSARRDDGDPRLPDGNDSADGSAAAPCALRSGRSTGWAQPAGRSSSPTAGMPPNGSFWRIAAMSWCVLQPEPAGPRRHRAWRSRGTSGVVEIRDGADITITGLEVTGYRTRSLQAVPVGIYATGATSGLRIGATMFHHLGNDKPHGRQLRHQRARHRRVLGARPPRRRPGWSSRPTRSTISSSAQSETVVVNGNVDGFRITDNSIHDNNFQHRHRPHRL